MSVILCNASSFGQGITGEGKAVLAVEFSSMIRLPGVTPVAGLRPPRELIKFYNANKSSDLRFRELIGDIYEHFLDSVKAEIGIRVIRDYGMGRGEVVLVCTPDDFFDYRVPLNDRLKDHGLFTKIINDSEV